MRARATARLAATARLGAVVSAERTGVVKADDDAARAVDEAPRAGRAHLVAVGVGRLIAQQHDLEGEGEG